MADICVAKCKNLPQVAIFRSAQDKVKYGQPVLFTKPSSGSYGSMFIKQSVDQTSIIINKKGVFLVTYTVFVDDTKNQYSAWIFKRDSGDPPNVSSDYSTSPGILPLSVAFGSSREVTKTFILYNARPGLSYALYNITYDSSGKAGIGEDALNFSGTSGIDITLYFNNTMSGQNLFRTVEVTIVEVGNSSEDLCNMCC